MQRVAGSRPISIENANGGAPVLLICDHASAHIPDAFEGLALPDAVRRSHAAWDPGALHLARELALLLNAPLIKTNVSRLIVDANRSHVAPDLIVGKADGVPVVANLSLSAEDRASRIAAYHAPFHQAIDGFLESRPNMRAVVSVHSFEPVLFEKARPWHVGLLHDADMRLADAVRMVLEREQNLVVGDNQPYSPADGVFYTLDRHGRQRGLATLMLEVRNDLLRSDAEVDAWAQRLAPALAAAVKSLVPVSQ
jgi:predicted N-formylglutamate amidohydrolase